MKSSDMRPSLHKNGSASRRCSICREPAQLVFRHQILRKHEVGYFYCPHCGLLQTEEPYWLDEAHGSAIAAADTGVLQRNLRIARALGCLLFALFGRKGRYLDVAGGYGLLTRLMRDAGFDFYWSDEYCTNVFARGFEAAGTQPPFTAVTAFEVLEHVPDPLSFISEALKQAECRTIILSTVLFREAPPDRDWWYYAFSTGQHICFYQARTLRALASRLGLNAYTSGSLHLLTDRTISETVFRLLVSHASMALFPLIRLVQPSRTIGDHQKLV